jgi:hypothetical protein
MIDRCMDFFMNLIAGLPIELAKRGHPALRPIFLIISLVWIPIMFLLFFPFIILWCVAAAIGGMWELLSEE